MDGAESYIEQIKEEAKKVDDEELRDLSERVALLSQIIVTMTGQMEELEERVAELEQQQQDGENIGDKFEL